MTSTPLPALVAFDSLPRTRLIFGTGSLANVGALARELGMTRILLVTDRGIVAAGHVERAESALRASGLKVTRYDGVQENPTTLDVAKCRDMARGAAIDGWIGLGGGSSMDTAKGANFLLTNGGEMKDYWGVGKATFPMLPLIAIPTTSGTGSECQSAALIADPVSHQKMACLDPKAAARIAILDPELTLSMPLRVTSVTGVDAIAHALETAVCTRRTALSSMYSRAAFEHLMPSFPVVLEQPGDVAARGRMLLGSALSGLAIENSMLGAAHSSANPLTAHFGLVHGIAVGLMLPHVLRHNTAEPAIRREYAALANIGGISTSSQHDTEVVEHLIAAVENAMRQAGVPSSLAQAGVPASALESLAAEASQQWTAKFNPRPMGYDDFVGLYRAAGGW